MKAYMLGEKNCRLTPASSNLPLSTVGHCHLKADDNSSPNYRNTDCKAACLNLAVQKFVWGGETQKPNPIFSLPFVDFTVSKAYSSSLKDTPSFSALQLHLNANRPETSWGFGEWSLFTRTHFFLCSCRALSSTEAQAVQPSGFTGHYAHMPFSRQHIDQW